MAAHLNKRNIVIGTIILLFIIVVGTVTYYDQFHKEDLNDSLPVTVQMEANEQIQENSGEHLLLQYLRPYQESTTSSSQRIYDVKYDEFQFLSGDEKQFTVGVTFEAKLEKGKWSAHRNWGKVLEDGTIKGIK